MAETDVQAFNSGWGKGMNSKSGPTHTIPLLSPHRY